MLLVVFKEVAYPARFTQQNTGYQTSRPHHYHHRGFAKGMTEPTTKEAVCHCVVLCSNEGMLSSQCAPHGPRPQKREQDHAESGTALKKFIIRLGREAYHPRTIVRLVKSSYPDCYVLQKNGGRYKQKRYPREV